MADVSVNVGVSGIQQFKQGMTDAQASVKTFDAALKANEKQLKASGNAENYMQAQTSLLNGKLKEQEKIAKNAEQALKQMEANGVKTTSKSYQDMQRKLIEAKSAMLDTQMELDGLGTKAADASGKTDKLADSLGGLNKKVSLEQVRSAVGSITQGLENAAKKAAELGQQLWDMMMDSARRADDTATMAQMYGIDLETFEKMQRLVANGMDTSVEAMLSAQDKLTKGIGKGGTDMMEVLEELGLAIKSGKDDMAHLVTDDQQELFWKAGQALLGMSDAFDKEAAAQKIFGRSWKELVPLFESYKTLDEFNAALDEQTVTSEESVRNLAELNDAVGKLEASWTTLKDEMLGAIAPALTKGAEAVSGLLDSLTQYLQTEDGQKMLENLGTAVEGLFSDLGSIDPQKVVEGFTGVFDKVVSGLEWLLQNKDTVIGALEGIVIGWGALKLTGGALDILKLISGLQGLTGGGAGLTSGAAAAGTAAGTSWATAFSSAAVAAAPWIASVFGITAAAVTPALIAGKADQERWNQQYGNRMAAAGAGGKNAWFIEQAANALGTDGQTNFGAVDSLLMGLASRQNQQKAELQSMLSGSITAGNDTWNLLNSFWQGAELDPNVVNELIQDVTDAMAAADTKPEVEIQPEVPEDAAEQIAKQVGTVGVPISFQVDPYYAKFMRDANNADGSHANGIWSVPFDGYAAILHKGERVVPAREIGSRSYNSNLYVESMYMNSGVDANGLASAMAAAQRRQMSGFGN